MNRPGIAPGELAEALGISRSAISQHLGALEKGGYLVRHTSEDDRRKQVLRLGPLGIRYERTTRQFEAYTSGRYLAKLNHLEIEEIVAALTKLRGAFSD